MLFTNRLGWIGRKLDKGTLGKAVAVKLLSSIICDLLETENSDIFSYNAPGYEDGDREFHASDAISAHAMRSEGEAKDLYAYDQTAASNTSTAKGSIADFAQGLGERMQKVPTYVVRAAECEDGE